MSKSVPSHHIQDIKFLGSFPKVQIAPKSELPEFAFVGRSNVGKSSLINYLCDRKKLAKTSSTPGKTQLINLFEVDQQWILADLPGYGYARVSKKSRAKFSKMIQQYLRNRENLATVFVLLDARHELQEMDRDHIMWLGEEGVPFSIIFTKVDKLKPKEIEHNVERTMNQLGEIFYELPNHFVTTSAGRTGALDVLEFIEFVCDQIRS